MRPTFLGVHIASLAAESRAIRRREIKAKKHCRTLRQMQIPPGERLAKVTASIEKTEAAALIMPEARGISAHLLALRREAVRLAKWIREPPPAYAAPGALDAAALRDELHQHRVVKVRKVTRVSHLAYGFLKGVAYSRMEAKSYTVPNFNEVERIAIRFSEESSQVIKQRFEEWMSAAREARKDPSIKKAPDATPAH